MFLELFEQFKNFYLDEILIFFIFRKKVGFNFY